jgi:hypothetical protein
MILGLFKRVIYQGFRTIFNKKHTIQHRDFGILFSFSKVLFPHYVRFMKGFIEDKINNFMKFAKFFAFLVFSVEIPVDSGLKSGGEIRFASQEVIHQKFKDHAN